MIAPNVVNETVEDRLSGNLWEFRARSQGMSTSSHSLVEPGEIGLLVLEETGDGVHQDGVGKSGLETTRFFERQATFHPALALITPAPLGAFTPEPP